VAAKQFILNADMIQRHQSGDMKKLKSQMAAQTAKIEEMGLNHARGIKIAIDSAKEKWEQEKAEAVEVGDADKVRKAEAKIKQLDEDSRQQDAGAALANQVYAEAQGREWYNDKFLRREAIGAGNDISAEGDDGKPWTDPVKFVDEVEEHLRRKYPEAFAKPSHKPTQVSPAKPAKSQGGNWNALVGEYPDIEKAFQDLTSLPGGRYKDDKPSRELFAKDFLREQRKL